MERPQRASNRIEDYDYSQTGAYFVTICTQDRRKILSKILVGDGFPVPQVPGKIAEEILCKIPEKYPCVSVDKYVIMPDHIHMLLRIDNVGEAFRLPQDGTGDPSPTLGTVMGWYKYQVTKQVNLQMQTPGAKIFQRSFYGHVI